MARFALLFGMSAFKLVVGLRVIEILRSVMPANQFEVFAVVVGVTFETGRPGHFGIGMIAFAGIDTGFKSIVTLQTFGGKNRFTQLVALRAVGNAFDLGVEPRKLARGDLGEAGADGN